MYKNELENAYKFFFMFCVIVLKRTVTKCHSDMCNT